MSKFAVWMLSPLAVFAAAAGATVPAPATPVAAEAGDRVTWAVCVTGEGCRLCKSPISHAQADAAVGAMGLIRENPGHTLVTMRRRDGEWTWYYDVRRSASELNEYFGGSGEAGTGVCPTLPGDIEPRDGLWSIANAAPTAEGCPAGVAERVAEMQLFRSGPVVFERPFRAGSALPDPAVSWVQVAPNRHVGHFAPAGQSAMQARYLFEVVSPDSMQGTLTVFVEIPGQPRCRIETPFTYTRSGD